MLHGGFEKRKAWKPLQIKGFRDLLAVVMSWDELLFNVFIDSSQFNHDNKTKILLTDLLDFTRFSASMRKKQASKDESFKAYQKI